MTIFGIIPVRLVDLIEIALVAYLLYKLYVLMRGTLAVSLFLGLIAIYLVQVLVGVFQMTILQGLFSSLPCSYVGATVCDAPASHRSEKMWPWGTQERPGMPIEYRHEPDAVG